MDLSIVNHLLVTQRFLVKGTVRTGDLRLSSFLNAVRRPWLAIENVTFTELVSGEKIVARRATLRLADLLLAHEYLDLAGDPIRKRLAQADAAEGQALPRSEYRMVSAWFRAPSRLEILGRIRQNVLDAATSDEFFVMQEPLLRGVDEATANLLLPVKDLPYAIVHRAQLHGWFEYE